MMKKIIVCLFVAAAFTTQTYSQMQQWMKDPDNRVLRKGAGGEWDSYIVENPYVLFDGTLYHMWYAGSDGSAGLKIGYAYSSDGKNWTKYDDPATIAPPYAESDPVLSIGPSGSWDGGHVLQPSIIFDGTTYHMWYGGTNGDLSERHIGYATSTDRIHWTKYSSNPVIAPGSSGSWDDVWVDSPNVLFINGIFHIWYCGFDGTYVQTGYATSSDGKNWTKYDDPGTTAPPYAESDPVLSIGPSGSWDNFWIYQPCIVTDGVRYHMWYSGGQSAFAWRIGYAVSLNGIDWTKYNNPATTTQPYAESDPVLSTGPSGSWEDTYVGQSSVVTNINSSGSITGYKMWYGGGVGFSNGEIGYATLDDPLPVELTSFTALAKSNVIMLNWSTATEINNHGFEIQRSTSGKEFSIVGFIDGYGTTSEQHNYRYADKNLDNGKYFYRLKQVDFDGSYEYSNVIEVELKALNSYILEQNYPNPFNPSTTIKYSIPKQSLVTIKIYDVLGREVATLVNEEKPAGNYKVEFSAKGGSASGGNAYKLSSGVYFYRLQASSFVETKKMILLR